MDLTRRDFLLGSAATAVATSLPDDSPEALVKAFHKSLSAAQRKEVVLPWTHKHRLHVVNNWNVTKPKIGQFFTADQRQLLSDIVKGLASAEGQDKFPRVMKGDNKGFENYTTAIFGDPEADRWVWFLTGRHLTLKCDGDTQEGAVFGGPIFYGHSGDAKDNFNEGPTHPGNVFWHQAKLANDLFGALDGKQREKALLADSPEEDVATLKLGAPAQGIAGAELSKDQRGLLEGVLRSILAPYRAKDVEEAMKAVGGVESLHLAFYADEDLGNDKVWDNWMIRGPKIAWFFRGNPHVHTWVNVGTAL